MINAAAERGPKEVKWWLDWRGKPSAIIASGPSIKGQKFDYLKDRLKVIAIKRNVELVPWADVVYGCDAAWWKSVNGLPDYSGLRLGWEETIWPQLPQVNAIKIPDKVCDRLLVDTPGVIGSGRNSGFQSLNIAVQFGSPRIMLIGVDVGGDGHWYGRNNWAQANNPDPSNFYRWKVAFSACPPLLKELNVEVVNTSMVTTLACFRKATIEETLRRWEI